MSPGPVRVELGVVHVAECGEKTYELFFVNADEVYGTQLVIEPDGTLRVIPAGEEDE